MLSQSIVRRRPSFLAVSWVEERRRRYRFYPPKNLNCVRVYEFVESLWGLWIYAYVYLHPLLLRRWSCAGFALCADVDDCMYVYNSESRL